MDRLADAPSRNSLLQRILLLTVLVGTLSSLVLVVARDSNRSTALPLAIAVAFLVYIITFIDLTLGLAILIACVGLSPELAVGGLANVRLEDFVAPALVLAWSMRSYQRRESLAPALVTGPLFIYTILVLLTTTLGIVSATTSLMTALLFMGKFVEYFLIFFLFANAVRTREEFQALTSFSLMVAVASSLQAMGLYAVGDAEMSNRLSGPLGETANIFGGYLILHLGIAAGLYLHAPTGGSRLAAASVLIMLGLPLLYTYSRTSFAALMIAMLLFGVIKDRRLIFVLLTLAAILPFMTPEAVWVRIASIAGVAIGPEPSSWISRLYAWGEAIKRVLADSPLIGFGTGSVRLGEVDSEYVRVFVDTGVVGLAIFIWIQGRLVRGANQLYDRLSSGTFEKGFAAGYWISLLAMLTHAIAVTSFTSIRTMETFMMITGLFTALNYRAKEWQPVPVGAPRVLVESAAVLNPRT